MITDILSPLDLKTKFNISEDDLQFLRSFGERSTVQMKNFIEEFHAWLPSLEEYPKCFQDSQKIQAEKNRQNAYWQSLFCGRLDQRYIDVRYEAGMTHARIGLSINTFCAEVNFSINWWTRCIDELIPDKVIAQKTNMAFRKLCMLDTALISDFYCNDLFSKMSDVSNEAKSILERAITAIEQIAVGEVRFEYKSHSDSEERFANAIKQLIGNLHSIIKQAQSIAQGNFATELKALGPNDELGASLVKMTNKLREMDAINKTSNWIKTGQAEISNIMKGDHDIHSLAKKTISYLCKYLDSLIGAFYLCINDSGQQKLKIIGTYAHDRRRALGTIIGMGEGLVGQAALEKEIIVFSDVPENYMSINSSLGQAIPRNLVVIPVTLDNEIYGVLELGSHKVFGESSIEFIKQIGNNIALSVKATQDHARIKNLLEESKAQTLKLQAQQEKLRISNEELEAQQRKLQNSNQELECKAEELRKSEESIKKQNLELEEISRRLTAQKAEIEQKNKAINLSQIELEAKAHELELSNKYKSEFLANMSHELRTPLNSLLILSENLAQNDDKNLTKEQIEAISIINSGGKDLLNLINDILDLSKVEAGKLSIDKEEVDLSLLLDRLKRQFEPMAMQKKFVFSAHFENSLPKTIFTDGHRIEQILKNFLSNAFKFTESGYVKLTFGKPSEQLAMSLSLPSHLAISVEDSGVGIKKEKLGLIFEAFQQADGSTSRRFGGTGLGLTIARQLAELLGGKIHVDSEFGVGSKFTLLMPIEEPAIHAQNESAAQVIEIRENENALVSRKKILIVEDDNVAAQRLCDLIKDRELEIDVVTTGMEAINSLKGSKYHAMILDFLLPDMSGMDLLKKLQNESVPNLPPIVVNTSRQLTKDEHTELSKHVASFVIKGPRSHERILEELDSFLENRPLPSAKKITATHNWQEKASLLSGRKILLVDDDMRNTYALSGILNKKGLRVVMADNGKLALEKLAAEEDIDLVIMDIMMPIMDGYEAMKRIREQKKHAQLPIIALTAKVLPEDRVKALDCGASDFLTKPVEMDRLLELMNIWISSTEKNL